MPESGFAVVAHLVRTQGRHGELIADILTDFPERFSERSRVWLLPPASAETPREFALERHWLHKGRVVLKFAGVDSIAEAEAYRGWDVAIPREERVSLADDSVYISDLIGCRLIDEANGDADLGPVLDVMRGEGGATDLLVLKKCEEELLIPFAKAYLVEVDLRARVLRMHLPAGLTEIDAPMTEQECAGRQQSEGDEGSDAL
ncbi:MAG TPA: ribosome maturation factor RimM [Acidobacteriaceae bacterium]|jgi:16S rRNA processing protein RimM